MPKLQVKKTYLVEFTLEDLHRIKLIMRNKQGAYENSKEGEKEYKRDEEMRDCLASLYGDATNS